MLLHAFTISLQAFKLLLQKFMMRMLGHARLSRMPVAYHDKAMKLRQGVLSVVLRQLQHALHWEIWRYHQSSSEARAKVLKNLRVLCDTCL